MTSPHGRAATLWIAAGPSHTKHQVLNACSIDRSEFGKTACSLDRVESADHSVVVGGLLHLRPVNTKLAAVSVHRSAVITYNRKPTCHRNLELLFHPHSLIL